MKKDLRTVIVVGNDTFLKEFYAWQNWCKIRYFIWPCSTKNVISQIISCIAVDPFSSWSFEYYLYGIAASWKNLVNADDVETFNLLLPILTHCDILQISIPKSYKWFFFLPNTIFFEKCIVAHFQVICKKVVLIFKPFLANLLNRLLHKTNGIKVSISILQPI